MPLHKKSRIFAKHLFGKYEQKFVFFLEKILEKIVFRCREAVWKEQRLNIGKTNVWFHGYKNILNLLFYQKRLQQRCFLVNFAKSVLTPFCWNLYERLSLLVWSTSRPRDSSLHEFYRISSWNFMIERIRHRHFLKSFPQTFRNAFKQNAS